MHRKSTAILDACFHRDMNELIHVHPPRETEPKVILSYGCCPKFILVFGEPHERGRSFFAMKCS